MDRANSDFNILQLDAVAKALGTLCKEVVFLGGAATVLLVPESAYAGVRRTEDVDVIIDVIPRQKYYEFCESLREKGFVEDTGKDAVICRWLAPTDFGRVKVDIMPTDEKILGFSNRWYKDAIRTADPYTLPSGTQIQSVSVSCFLATKLEAFKSRGGGDYFSHDIEDIIFVMENRENLALELLECEYVLKNYLATEMMSLLNDDFLNVLPGLLEDEDEAKNIETTIRLISRW